MFGCIPDRLEQAEKDARLRHVIGLVGANPGFPSWLDYEHLLDFVPDQGRTNSCVAQYVSSALYLRGQTARVPIRRPSQRWAYAVGRYVDAPSEPLNDLGSRCWSMLEGLSKHGVVAADRLPLTDDNVNEPPPFDADLLGADAKLTGYYKLEGNLPTLVRMTLAAGHFPGFAMRVHQSFLDLPAGQVHDEPSGAELGNHMVTCIGYRPGQIRILNSWGANWADGGFAWLSDRFVASHYVFDRYAITAAPILT